MCLISKHLLKGPLALGRWRSFVFGEGELAKMSGGEWLEAFVSGWLFWFYLCVRGDQEKDMKPARSLDIRDSILIPCYMDSRTFDDSYMI